MSSAVTVSFEACLKSPDFCNPFAKTRLKMKIGSHLKFFSGPFYTVKKVSDIPVLSRDVIGDVNAANLFYGVASLEFLCLKALIIV